MVSWVVGLNGMTPNKTIHPMASFIRESPQRLGHSHRGSSPEAAARAAAPEPAGAEVFTFGGGFGTLVPCAPGPTFEARKIHGTRWPQSKGLRISEVSPRPKRWELPSSRHIVLLAYLPVCREDGCEYRHSGKPGAIGG